MIEDEEDKEDEEGEEGEEDEEGEEYKNSHIIGFSESVPEGCPYFQIMMV